MTEQMPGQHVPVRRCAANDRLASLRLAQRPDVDAARFAQVGLSATLTFAGVVKNSHARWLMA